MLPSTSRKALRHRDRWRVADMLTEQPDLTSKDPRRDMDLWRHLFAPDEIVRVGLYHRAACEAAAAEWCWRVSSKKPGHSKKEYALCE